MGVRGVLFRSRWIKPAAALEAEREQALLGRQAVIIEGVDPVGHVDMVASESCRRFDPSGVKADVRVTFEKRKRQHLTGAVGEEMPVGSMPVPNWIILDVDLWEEHPVGVLLIAIEPTDSVRSIVKAVFTPPSPPATS